MTCPVCGRIRPQETYKYCPVCGHRFGDPMPEPADAPPPSRPPSGPVRPAPATPSTALTYGVTDAPMQIDRHHIDAGQPTATTSDGGQLWVIRHVAAGYQTVHETWATSTGEIGGGTSQQYFDAEVSVLFDAPYQDGRLLAQATLAPDDDAHVLHVTALTILLWSPGHSAPDTPDIHLDFRDDVTRVLRIERASQSDRSSRSAPTADDTRAYEHCVPAVHTFLVALPDSPWRGYGLSHDDVRYEALRWLRRRT